MIVIGLDLSMKQTGIAVYDTDKDKFLLITSLNTEKISKKGNAKPWEKLFYSYRLKFIFDELLKIKKEYKPDEMVVEKGFSRFNTSTQVVYRVHAIASLVFYDIPSTYYPSTEIKSVTTGYGRAKKSEVREAVKKRYPNIEMDNNDESDACAIIATHMINTNPKYDWIDKQEFFEELEQAKAEIEKEKKEGK